MKLTIQFAPETAVIFPVKNKSGLQSKRLKLKKLPTRNAGCLFDGWISLKRIQLSWRYLTKVILMGNFLLMGPIGSWLAVGADSSLAAVPIENISTKQGAIASEETLSVGEILTRVQTTYSSLSSYHDEGYVTEGNGDTHGTFTTSLARTIFCRGEWVSNDGATGSAKCPSVQVAWSSGLGGCMKSKFGVPKQTSLAQATSLFEDVTMTVPLIFFNQAWMDGAGLDDLIYQGKRLSDEKVGGEECFVCERASQGKTNTLWIGQQDYLGHQFRTVVSAEAMRGLLAKYMEPDLSSMIQGYTRTEIHTNIKLNPTLSRCDFQPSIPVFFDDE